jgi:hypothetical protein
MPSSWYIFLIHWVADKLLHNYNLYLITSAGALNISWAKVLEAPIIKVESILNLLFLNSNFYFNFS